MSDAQALSREQQIARICELIRGIPYAMLTSEGKGGVLHSRPMATQETDFDGDIWFLTKNDSGKADEIRHDANVSLSYSNPKESRFVSISGKAEIVQDRARVCEMWIPEYKVWFPEGENDPDIAVLRVHAIEAEYWESSASGLIQAARVELAATTSGETSAGTGKKLRIA